MKILQLCLRSPYPPTDGGTIAMYNMAMALHKSGAQVKIVGFNTKKHFVDASIFPADFSNYFNPELVFLDATVKPLPALLSLAGNGSYNISRFNSKLFRTTLEQVMDREQFDVVQMESLFMTPYIDTIRNKSNAAIVLRSHNVEFLIWQRLASSEKNKIKKWYLNLLSNRLKKYETSIVNSFDSVIALTEEDRRLYSEMGCTVPVLVSPIGLDTEKYQVNFNNSLPLSVVHLGSMDWLPNLEAINWFLDKIYPLLKSKKVQVHLAGKNMPRHIYEMADEQLVVAGRIDDSRAYLADKQIMIVPLLSGGGMRVKIIEGLAMGKTIISTTIGAEGIGYTNGKNLIIADTPEDFFNAIMTCITNPVFAFNIGKEARLLAEKVYENKVLGSQILSFYKTIGAPLQIKSYAG